MATTYTRTCTRCSGTGFYGNRGFCFRCWGGGEIEITAYTAAEKADRELFAKRRIAAYYAVKEASKRRPGGEYPFNVMAGFDMLEQNEPDCFRKMLDSLDVGRLYDVTIALAAYAKENR